MYIGEWEIASPWSARENWGPGRYMEGTFLDEFGTLKNHQQLFWTGFHSLGHSSILQNGIAKTSQFKSVPCCIIDPQRPIVGTFVSCNWPRQTSKGGHLKRITKAWVTELQRRGQWKAQLQTQYQLKPDWKSQEQNQSLECITSINETVLSPGSHNMLNPTNKNQYSCPTSVWLQSVWSWCFTNCYNHVYWGSREGTGLGVSRPEF